MRMMIDYIICDVYVTTLDNRRNPRSDVIESFRIPIDMYNIRE